MFYCIYSVFLIPTSPKQKKKMNVSEATLYDEIEDFCTILQVKNSDTTDIADMLLDEYMNCTDTVDCLAQNTSTTREMSDIENLRSVILLRDEDRTLKMLEINRIYTLDDSILLSEPDEFGRTVLHLSSMMCLPKVVRNVIRLRKSLLYAKDHRGNIPLHLTLSEKTVDTSSQIMDTLMYLITADVKTLFYYNLDRKTPFHLALIPALTECIDNNKDYIAFLLLWFSSTITEDRRYAEKLTTKGQVLVYISLIAKIMISRDRVLMKI